MQRLPTPLVLALLVAGCASGPHATASRGTYFAQSMAVDCRPGESSVVCCIKKFPTTAVESCGAGAGDVAEVLNGTRVLNEATKADEEGAPDDFANNADLPEWKQRCIRNYVSCQDEGWTGTCIDCLRYCEGQQEWPLDKCNERKKRVRQ
ncbi:hypothetical protein ACLESD_18220 [Pyxidicoccus sp. 3LFB2]